MERKYYNKLVRDRIPDKIRQTGGKCKVRTLSLEGHIESLLHKTEEERQEFMNAETKEQRLAEAADLAEVVLKIWQLRGISTLQQKLARQNFRDLFSDTSLDLHAELKTHTDALQKEPISDDEITTATGAQVEALLNLIVRDGYTAENLNQQILVSRKQRGGFDKGYLLIWATAY